MHKQVKKTVERGSQALYEAAFQAWRARWEVFDSLDAKASGLMGYVAVIVALCGIWGTPAALRGSLPLCLVKASFVCFLLAVFFALGVLLPKPVGIPADPAEVVEFWNANGDEKTYGLLVENLIKLHCHLKRKHSWKIIPLKAAMVMVGLGTVLISIGVFVA